MRQRGFTLIELLVVLVIIGLTLGLVTVNLAPSQRQAMQQDAQRVALLLQLARDEAIVRNRPIAFEASEQGYRFLVRDGREWKTLPQDDMLREREFKRAPVTLLLDPHQSPRCAAAHRVRPRARRQAVRADDGRGRRQRGRACRRRRPFHRGVSG